MTTFSQLGFLAAMSAIMGGNMATISILAKPEYATNMAYLAIAFAVLAVAFVAGSLASFRGRS